MALIGARRHDTKAWHTWFASIFPITRNLFAGLIVFVTFWLSVTPPQEARIAQLTLGAFAVLGVTLSARFPLPGALIAAIATAAAWVLGVTADPFLLASLGVYAVAEQRGSRRLPWWLISTGTLLMLLALLFGGTSENSAFELRMRGALLSAVLCASAWMMGVRTRQMKEHSAARARADERLRLARDVHDALSHSLGAIGVQAGVAAHVMDLNESTLRQTLRNIESQARASLADLQELLQRERADMEPARSFAARLPTLSLLRNLADSAEQSGLRVALTVSGDLEGMPTKVSTTVHRIAQEAVTNAIRHAEASNLKIHVAVTDTSVEVSVSDNGHGSQSGFTEGYGLTGMRERVEMLGGELSLESGPAGFSIRARLPITTSQLSSRPQELT